MSSRHESSARVRPLRCSEGRPSLAAGRGAQAAPVAGAHSPGHAPLPAGRSSAWRVASMRRVLAAAAVVLHVRDDARSCAARRGFGDAWCTGQASASPSGLQQQKLGEDGHSSKHGCCESFTLSTAEFTAGACSTRTPEYRFPAVAPHCSTGPLAAPAAPSSVMKTERSMTEKCDYQRREVYTHNTHNHITYRGLDYTW